MTTPEWAIPGNPHLCLVDGDGVCNKCDGKEACRAALVKERSAPLVHIISQKIDLMAIRHGIFVRETSDAVATSSQA